MLFMYILCQFNNYESSAYKFQILKRVSIVLSYYGISNGPDSQKIIQEI